MPQKKNILCRMMSTNMYPSKITGLQRYIKNKESSEHLCNKTKQNKKGNITKQKTLSHPEEKNSHCLQTHCQQHHSIPSYSRAIPKSLKGKKSSRSKNIPPRKLLGSWANSALRPSTMSGDSKRMGK